MPADERVKLCEPYQGARIVCLDVATHEYSISCCDFKVALCDKHSLVAFVQLAENGPLVPWQCLICDTRYDHQYEADIRIVKLDD